MALKLIQQGAEAKILLDEKNNLIVKDRISKSYRHPDLDAQIRKRRTKSETKLLEKAFKIISVPKLIKTDEKEKIEMQFINGKKLSENLNNFTLEKQKEICREIGESVAKLHKENIIHGDLTTSNMILVEAHQKAQQCHPLRSHPLGKAQQESSQMGKDLKFCEDNKSVSQRRTSGRVGGNRAKFQDKIFFIDFGLGYISNKTEDKAVDLHLLKHALEAKHFKNCEILIKEVLKSYEKILGKIEAKKIFERMKAIEKRGRYRH